MLAEINVTDEDISYAERILLDEGKTFDDERRVFLRDFTTLDLQAVPGSGKTTLLLAKLLILEKHLPFKDNSGVLVLSHTNVAVDEIKNKLSKLCPKLFSYPNFIGTIQSFVDTFLCIPMYVNKYKRKIYRIDDEIFDERHFMPHQCSGFLGNRVDGEKILRKSRLHGEDDLIMAYGETGSLPFANKNSATFIGLVNLKKSLRSKGVLCFDDAYILAEQYLLSYTKSKKILQDRFKFVFVDEMQDMDIHQFGILEKLFSTESVVYQRIGDKNQSIYSNDAKIQELWTDNHRILNLNGSHRLSDLIAELVNCFALNRQAGFQVIGLRRSTIKPHLLVYSQDNITNVITKFSEIVSHYRELGEIEIDEKAVIKAIGWIKESGDPNRTGLKDYFPDFSKEKHTPKIDFNSLEDYLEFYDKSKQTLRPIRNNILNAFLRILRLEQVVDPRGWYYNKENLISHLRESYPNEFESFKTYLFQWSLNVIKGKKDNVLSAIRGYIPTFLQVFQKVVQQSSNFINSPLANPIHAENEPIKTDSNKVNFHGFDIEITTIHSAKGQTHTATLYLETDYYAECESSRLSNQFRYNQIQNNAGARIKQSAKMFYVGVSRPTHMLCVAVRKERFDEYLSNIDREKWEIVSVF